MTATPANVLDGMRVIEGSAFVAAPLGGMTLAHRLPHSSVVARSNAQSSTELDACATRRDLQLGHPWALIVIAVEA